jgi:hypothetical protein
MKIPKIIIFAYEIQQNVEKGKDVRKKLQGLLMEILVKKGGQKGPLLTPAPFLIPYFIACNDVDEKNRKKIHEKCMNCFHLGFG